MASDVKFNIKAEVKGTDEVFEFTKAVDGAYVAVNNMGQLLNKQQRINGKIVKTFQEYNEAVSGTSKANIDAAKGFKQVATMSKDTEMFLDNLRKQNAIAAKEIASGNAILADSAYKAAQTSKKTAEGIKEIGKEAGEAKAPLLDFSKIITGVSAVSVYDVLRKGVGFVKETIKEATTQAMDLQSEILRAKQYGLEFVDSVEAARYASSSATKYATTSAEQMAAITKAAALGFRDISEAAEIANNANKLAIGSSSTLGDAVNTLASVMNTYKVNASEAAEVTDALYVFTRITNADMSELSNAFSRGAQAASALGISFKEVLATGAILQRTGMATAETFTAVRAVTEALVTPTEKAKKAVAELNAQLALQGKELIDLSATGVEQKGISGLLFQIEESSRAIGKTDAQTKAVIKNILGMTRASTPAFAILKAGFKGANDVAKEFDKSVGRAQEGFELIQRSLAFQSKQKSAAFTTGYSEGIQPLITLWGEIMTTIDEGKIAETMRNIASIGNIVVSTVTGSISTALKSIGFLTDEIERLGESAGDLIVKGWVKAKGSLGFFNEAELKQELDKLAAREAERDSARKKSWEDIQKIVDETSKSVEVSMALLAGDEATEKQIKTQQEKKKIVEQQLQIQKEISNIQKEMDEKAEKELKNLQLEYRLLGETEQVKKVINTLSKLGYDTSKLIVDSTGSILSGYEQMPESLQKVYQQLSLILQKETEIKEKEDARNDLTNWTKQGGQWNSMIEFADNYKDSMMSLGDVLMNTFQNTEDAIIDFCKTGKSSFSDMVNLMIEDLTRLIIQQQLAGLAKLISSTAAIDVTGQGVTGGNVTFTDASYVGAASGGLITGPGTGTSDSIPAWLSNGEFVMNAQATAKYLPLLRQMNENKFASGGLVGSARGYNNGVDIQVIDQRGANAAPVQTQQSEGPDGRKIIKMMIRDTVRQGFADGSYDTSMRSTYGIRRSAYQR